MPADSRPILRLAHSPDPDDAFMWWPLFSKNGQPPRIDTGRFQFKQITADIEALNQRSSSDDALEITAISCAQFPHVQNRYVLTACGASMGEKYGPKLVAREALTIDQLRSKNAVIAIPGTRTSAFAALSMLLGQGKFRYEVVPFEHIIDQVQDGKFDAGLVIHEGQLTYQDAGLQLLVDLGEWWWSQHQLPLPLGVNVVRRNLETLHGPGTLLAIARVLQSSLEYALKHRPESVQVAMEFARGIATAVTDEFIHMYVNHWTVDFGERGLKAVSTFLQHSHAIGITPKVDRIDWIAEPPRVIGSL